MTDTDAHLPSTDLLGTWSGEVRFTAGPLEGDIHPDAWLLADDGILVQLRSRRGVGEWESKGNGLSFAFYEVLLNDAAKPNGVVRVTASGTLAPGRSAFEAIGRYATSHHTGCTWRESLTRGYQSDFL
jgi:hypothetical protein